MDDSEARVVRKLLAEIERVKKLYAWKAHILAIRGCTPDIFELADMEKLNALGIEGCEVLKYFSDVRDVIAPPDREIAGRMIPVMTVSGRKSVILLRERIPQLNASEEAIYRICVIYHELVRCPS